MGEEQYKWMVCVRCMTYNQASYIVDAMNGFTMQQTTFPYVCAIVDDASTDGEPDVIRKYLDEHFNLDDQMIARHEETDDYVMTFAQHKENRNCHFAVYFLKYNHYGKKRKEPYYECFLKSARYFASCEGDDYWTESRKLQMQYDYLESHPEVVLSCHRWSILDLKTNSLYQAKNVYFDSKKHWKEKSFEFDLNFYLNTWVTKTLTCMVRASAVKKDYYKGYKYARDVHYYYYIMAEGRGVCHAFNGGIYRKNVPTSIYGNLDRVSQQSINCKVYEEIAMVTQDPLVRKAAQKMIVIDCINRLKSVGGGYFVVTTMLNKIYNYIDFIKRVFRHHVPPISSR